MHGVVERWEPFTILKRASVRSHMFWESRVNVFHGDILSMYTMPIGIIRLGDSIYVYRHHHLRSQNSEGILEAQSMVGS